jgi:hypothetical protein
MLGCWSTGRRLGTLQTGNCDQRAFGLDSAGATGYKLCCCDCGLVHAHLEGQAAILGSAEQSIDGNSAAA